MPHGFSDSEWAAGVAEMTAILQKKAATRSMITYSDLAKEMKAVTIGYHDPAMDDMLLDVSEGESQKGRGLLSVIVVHKYGDMEPGAGFYKLAELRDSTLLTGQNAGSTN
jgi:hypothetical protein